MRSAVRACSMLLMTCALSADSASARDYLNCLTNKVVIVDAGERQHPHRKPKRTSASRSTKQRKVSRSRTARRSSSVASMTRWISATRGDVSYELDRQDGNLTYASATTKDGVTTIVIGSGRCKLATPGR